MKGSMVYPDDRKWYERPLLCILGLHETRPHPGGTSWEVCDRCEGERAVL